MPIVQTGMGWVAGPRLVERDRERGRARHPRVGDDDASTSSRPRSARCKARTDRPFGVNLRADAEDAAARVDLLVASSVPVASFALAPRERPDQDS